MNPEEEAYISHFGTPRHSGRYPYGSGGDLANKRNKDLLDHIEMMKQKGLDDNEIRIGLGMTTTEWRARKSVANAEQKQARISEAQRLRDKGMGPSAIGRQMGIGESSVRALLQPGEADKANVTHNIADSLRREVETKQFVDIGGGVENTMNVPKDRLGTAVQILKDEGYEVHPVQVDQGDTINKTYVKVLCPPGTSYRDAVAAKNENRIRQIQEYSHDGGRTSLLGIEPPLSVSSKRIAIRYGEDGGAPYDGVMYLRPGVKDLTMGTSSYAQVRIAVDGTHYLKGMAIYKDDLPPGVDIMFNTPKTNTGNKLDALKKMERTKEGDIDPDNPFGSAVRQIFKTDKNGNPTKELSSALNLVNEEGQWGEWSKNLSSQFLSKQSPVLAKTQLDMTYESRKNQLDTILKLTNPAVKKKLLEDFAEDVDAAAVHLKAASLPRQATRVLLPINSLKDTEIYAPHLTSGERVVLVRFPHGGTFEIPELVVNNRNKEGIATLGAKAADAVGINANVAKRLSGADFDGDTVLVIPQGAAGKVNTKSPLAGLKDFDPGKSFPLPDDAPRLSSDRKQQLMGDVSNLITDMTIKGASDAELARAVRHSMVVIDAEKHHLNYKLSAQQNNIPELKAKYQNSARGGASTIVSQKKSKTITVNERKRNFKIDPETGKKVWIETGASFPDRTTGETIFKTQRVNLLANVDDASVLSSGTYMEKVYVNHSNRLKDLANQARKAQVATPPQKYNESAAKAYKNEVARLDSALNLALQNRPRERAARLMAQATVSTKRAANPNMDKAEIKKLQSLALEEARTRHGARKDQIKISQEEWNAVQAGAISNHKLEQILRNSDLESIKALATPKVSIKMTSAKKSRATAMLAAGYSQAEVAQHLGVSLTTLKTALV